MKKYEKFLPKLTAVILIFLFTISPFKLVLADTNYYITIDSESRMSSQNNYIRTGNSTGFFEYSVAVEIAPGRNNLQPDLSLNYNNYNKDNSSLFGYGWDLNIPYIERINRTGSENLYKDDYFYSSLDGELKSVNQGMGGEQVLGSLFKDIITYDGSLDKDSKNFNTSDLTKKNLLKEGLAYKKDDGSIIMNSPVELKEKRSKNSKVYFEGYDKESNPIYEGRFYARDSHYLNSFTGKFEDINTSLLDDGKDLFMNKASYSVNLKKSFDENFIKFKNKGQELNFSLINDAVKTNSLVKKTNQGEWKNKQVSYKDVLGSGIDIVVSLDNEALIKDVVINSIDSLGDLTGKDYYDIPFKLSSNKDINIRVGDKLLSQSEVITTDKMVEIIDSDGVISYIWPPVIRDSSKNLNNIKNIDIEYSKVGNDIYLTKKIPTSWLKNAIYPVRTDATVSYYPGFGDGVIGNSGYNFSSIRNASSGNYLDYTFTDATSGLSYDGNSYWTDIKRAFLPIDTSSLDDSAFISSASLKLYTYHVVTSSYGIPFGFLLVEGTQTSTSSLSFDDYDAKGIVAWSDVRSSWYKNSYNSISLNSTGINNINLTGYTKLAILENYHDFLGNQPQSVYDGQQIVFYTSEKAGTNYDPYLSITYTINSAPNSPTNLEVEGQTNPLSVLDSTPEFSSIFSDIDPSDLATAYQVQVSTSTSDWTNPLWDSTKINLTTAVSVGSRTEEISYGGNPLPFDGSKYYWRMKLWDSADTEGYWSDGTDNFTMYTDAPTELQVENQTNPTKVRNENPRFSAIYNNIDPLETAEYYQIQVATSTDWSNLIWDSTKTQIASSTPVGMRIDNVVYNGSIPIDFDGTQYFWRIKFWDSGGNESLWSNDVINYFITASTVEYGAKVENGGFIKYEYLGNGIWHAFDKKGVVYKFGYSENSRQDNPDDSLKIYKWMLQEIRDTNGNYIKYEYFKDNGQIYPSKITYTGNGSSDGIFEVNFLRESRQDDVSSFKTGFGVKTNYRIKEINNTINGEWSKKYSLGYTTGANGVRSLLSSVTESGRDENLSVYTLPSNTFEYKDSVSGWTYDSNYSVPSVFKNSSGDDLGFRLSDINGDGLVDIVKSYYTGIAFQKDVYVNKGDGTGWQLDVNYVVPSLFKDFNDDGGSRFMDVNGDGLVDIVESRRTTSEYKNVYLNKGDSTGWQADSSYVIPTLFQDSSYGDLGVRFADVNGDGLVDILRSHKLANGTEFRNVYINKGDGTGWQQDINYTIPVLFFQETNNYDFGVRLADINGDGLVDMIRSHRDGNSTISKVTYINKGDGTGWQADSNYTIPTIFSDYESGLGNAGAYFSDVNGDGLADIIKSFRTDISVEIKEVYINKGDGTGWTLDTSYSIPTLLTNYDAEVDGRLVDVNGDGIDDILAAYTNSVGTDIKNVYINNSGNSDSLIKVNTSKGSEISILYKATPEYKDESNNLLNPSLPFILQTVEQTVNNDGLGNYSTTTYEYKGGDFYYADEYDRKFAGFSEVEKTNNLGFITKTFYHQGNNTASSTGEYIDHDSKIGKVYKEEIYDNSNNLFSKFINKWERYELGIERDFVKLTQKIDFSYDGDADHKDKAETYTYDDTTGNLIQSINWGEVSGSDDGTFTDIGIDKSTADITYASNVTAYILGFPSEEITIDQNSNKVKETKYYYDDLALGSINKGNLTKQEDWVSGSTYINFQKTYNSYGLVTQETDPRGKMTSYNYDVYNLYPASITNALSQTISYLYDYSLGKSKQTTDANGRVFETVYDALDRVKEVKQPDITSPSTLVTKEAYIYYDNLLPRSIHKISNLDSLNSVDIYTYLDGFDRKIQERKEAENANTFMVKDFTYNALGLVEKESLPYFSTGTSTTPTTATSSLFTTYTYDALKRATTVVNSVATITNTYDDWKLTVTDGEGNIKHSYKDARDNLVKVEEVNATSTYTTNYNYNTLGNLIRITDALSNERNFTYDGLGRLLTSQDLHNPADLYFGTWSYTYDDSGNLTQKQNPNSQTVNYTYDDINRVLTEDYTGDIGIEVSYGYDSCFEGVGRLCSVTTTDMVLNNSYNALGLVSSETKTIDSTNYQTNYDYDRQGNMTLLTQPDSSQIKYEYNTAGLLEKVSQKEAADSFSSTVTDIDYSPLGQITYLENANGIVANNTYDADKLYRLINKTTTISTTNLQDLTYTYDSVGNITKIVDASDTNSAKTLDFVYDNLYRLITASTTNATNTQDYLRTFSYNAIGNITNKSDQGAYLYQGDQGASYANPHAATSINGQVYSYDNNGNLINNGTWAYIWSYNNKLTQSGSGTATSTYTYDHQGQRIKLDNGTNTSIYPSKYYNISSDGTITKHIFTPSGELLATIEGNGTATSTKYIHTDHLGGSSVITDENGNIVELTDYYPFGDIRLDEKAGSFSEQRKFTGHEYDKDTDLTYANARYYPAKVGRFLSQDPVYINLPNDDRRVKVLEDPQLLNSYSYVRNNPLIHNDPEGEFLNVILGAGAGIVGQYGYDVFNNIQENGLNASSFTSNLSSLKNYTVRAGQGALVGFTGGLSVVGQMSVLGQSATIGVTSGVVGVGADSFLGQQITPQSVLSDTIVGGASFGLLKSVPKVPGRLPKFGTVAFNFGKHTQQSAGTLGFQGISGYLSDVFTDITSISNNGFTNTKSNSENNNVTNKQKNK